MVDASVCIIAAVGLIAGYLFYVKFKELKVELTRIAGNLHDRIDRISPPDLDDPRYAEITKKRNVPPPS